MAKLHFRPYIPNQTVLFPQRIDENILEADPVRVVSTLVDHLNLDSFNKLYKRINETIRSWHLNRHSNLTLEHLASNMNPIIRGWMTYYGKFYPTCLKWFMQMLNTDVYPVG